ncbi:MAG: hypothetical protein M0Z62_14760 [Actinomycetota bacterium]|jgi:hypothetical protein|nr:hypothetical protein [Actinomycetota bacterium]
MSSSSDTGVPWWLLPLQLGYLALLMLLALLHFHWSWAHRLVGNTLGPIPLAVPWWGALGGITISLTGVFKHASSWDRSYENWHVARPIMGAIMGSVGYLIFIVVIRSTGASVSTATRSGGAAFDLVAFLVGYREAVFRELLRKAVDVLLAPGSSTSDATAAKTHDSAEADDE